MLALARFLPTASGTLLGAALLSACCGSPGATISTSTSATGTTSSISAGTTGSTGRSSASSAGTTSAASTATSNGGSSTGTMAGTSASTSGASTTSVTGTSGSASTTGGGSSSGAGTSSGSTTGGVTCALSITNPLYIDGYAGVDSPCCGATVGLACHSITQAMANFNRSPTFTNEVFHAFMSNGAADWTGPESWPITLQFGVTLHAPSVFFSSGQSTPTDLFHFNLDRAGNDFSSYVGLEGNPANPVSVGFSSSFDSSGTATAVSVIGGATLHVQDANLGGAIALRLGAPASGGQPADRSNVQFGPDPVYIGDLAHGVTGANGIVCDGVNASAQSVLSDYGAAAQALFIEGQTTGITVNSFCAIDMTLGFSIGPAPAAGHCPTKSATLDQTGLAVHGNGSVQADLLTIQCQAGDGVFVAQGDDAGTPFVELNGATLQHNGCAGFHALAGQQNYLSSTLGPTRVSDNHYGLEIEGGYFGGAPGATLACSTAAEPGNCAGVGPGIDVWQRGGQAVLVDRVTWDSAAPMSYACGPGLTACTWGNSPPLEAEIVIEPADAGVVSATSPSSTPATCP